MQQKLCYTHMLKRRKQQGLDQNITCAAKACGQGGKDWFSKADGDDRNKRRNNRNSLLLPNVKSSWLLEREVLVANKELHAPLLPRRLKYLY